MSQFIYLIREREFLKSKEDVYKVGKTTQEPNVRMRSYPKGSELYVIVLVSDCDVYEGKILEVLRKKYKPRTDIGAEYFEGSSKDMMNDIFDIIRDDSLMETKKVDPKLMELYGTITEHYPKLKEYSPLDAASMCRALIEEELLDIQKQLDKTNTESNKLWEERLRISSDPVYLNGNVKLHLQFNKLVKKIEKLSEANQKMYLDISILDELRKSLLEYVL
jgi:hypothetical protein